MGNNNEEKNVLNSRSRIVYSLVELFNIFNPKLLLDMKLKNPFSIGEWLLSMFLILSFVLPQNVSHNADAKQHNTHFGNEDFYSQHYEVAEEKALLRRLNDLGEVDNAKNIP